MKPSDSAATGAKQLQVRNGSRDWDRDRSKTNDPVKTLRHWSCTWRRLALYSNAINTKAQS